MRSTNFYGFLGYHSTKKKICLSSGSEAMPVRACTCSGKAFFPSICSAIDLRVTEKCLHDANVIMATILARLDVHQCLMATCSLIT